jgi:cytochrome c peroxidase
LRFYAISVLLGAVISAAQLPPVPKGFPPPSAPPGNPLTIEKAELGRYLFYDRRMSVNGTTSCATCHRQELAFTDGRARAIGATGERHRRSSMSLVNVAWNTTLDWSDPSVRSLEQQALRPMMAAAPVELGYRFIEGQFLAMARTDPLYSRLFPRAFPGEPDPWTTANVAKALASFERTIVSRDSPWDRFHFAGDKSAIPAAAKRGEMLFFLDNSPSCFRCHRGYNFSGASMPGPGMTVLTPYHNTGLYNMYPRFDRGLFEFTGKPEDDGRFVAPTLRDIAITAPYMHDGSVATLGDVLDRYAKGGRGNPHQDPLVRGFRMTPGNQADLIAFLESLTDSDLLHRPDLSDPFAQARASSATGSHRAVRPTP